MSIFDGMYIELRAGEPQLPEPLLYPVLAEHTVNNVTQSRFVLEMAGSPTDAEDLIGGMGHLSTVLDLENVVTLNDLQGHRFRPVVGPEATLVDWIPRATDREAELEVRMHIGSCIVGCYGQRAIEFRHLTSTGIALWKPATEASLDRKQTDLTHLFSD